MPRNAERIGIFGGTFDPVHNGHLVIARAVFEAEHLDRVVFVPSARPPHKGGDIMFSAADRMKLLDLALHTIPDFEASPIELNREGPSYTIDTLREMKAAYPAGTGLFFIVGRDNLFEMESWKDPAGILDACTVLVADRSCQRGSAPSWISGRVRFVPTPVIDISSSMIRKRLRDGLSIRHLVPDTVADEIERIRMSASDGMFPNA